VALDGVQGEEEALADLLIGEPFRDEAEDFQLAPAQYRFGRRALRRDDAPRDQRRAAEASRRAGNSRLSACK
jgi:hypothetical protein